MDRSDYEQFSKDAVIVNELGLHARSAAKIAEIARTAKSKIWIIRDGEKADAASIIDMLTLACSKGTTVKIAADYPADIEILNRIKALIQNGFGE
ncbi:MAG: HPr family phosphocarrier protein [Desulfobacteraceae bacterium IS3]|nr:MAG: HPr family phosphocarrier protein [Desulfobacteraceae bacterium IS3]